MISDKELSQTPPPLLEKSISVEFHETSEIDNSNNIVGCKKILIKKLNSPKELNTTNTQNTKTINKQNTKTINKKKSRCGFCSKKISILDVTIGKCRCEYSFCSEHRLPEHHECDFNFQVHGKQELNKKNPQIVADKLCRI